MLLNARRTIGWLCAALLLTGCATSAIDPAANSTDILLDAPLDQVKIARVNVLSNDGYPVREGTRDDRVIITGYRREIDGIWDWLLKSRFGVGRSKVEATLSPATQDTTRLTVSVIYHVKDHIWSIWQDAVPPPHRDAGLQIRSVKKALGLL